MDIVRALCEAALARDYHVLIADATGAGRQETAYAEVLVDRAVVALIFNGPNVPEAVALARVRGIPVVVVERYRSSPRKHC